MTENTKEKLTPQQEKAIFHDGGDMLVSASAGSGKTFVIIERLIRLIEGNKTEVKNVLLVTFTEAAAKEMKEKLKKALCDSINKGNVRFGEQLNDIATADICTMHSFCARLIRQFFYVAGTTPDFKIIDETQSASMRAQTMDKVIKGYFERGDKDFAKVFDRYAEKRKSDVFKNLLFKIYDYAEGEKDPDEFYDRYERQYSEEGFNKLAADYTEFLHGKISKCADKVKERLNCLDGYDKCKARAEGFIAYCDDLLKKDVFGIAGFGAWSNNTGEKKFASESAERAFKECKAAEADVKDAVAYVVKQKFDKETERAKNTVLYSHTAKIVEIIRKFKEEYDALKREENALDFNDLERYAVKLLSDEMTKESVKSRYSYIFVDEYQDTNPKQEAIISAIQNDNVFMVGDEKQSIYRFRGCRPEYFREKYKTLSVQGKTERLNANFRSAENVINAVNKVFSYCMTEDFYGEDYSEHKLVGGGVYPENAKGRVEFHEFKDKKNEKELAEPKIYDVLDAALSSESQVSVTKNTVISDIIFKELGKQYYDFKEKREKRVEYGDIAVLTLHRESGDAQRIVNELIARDIPVTSKVKQSLTEYPEIIVLINALKLMDCFYQDVPLATVLKSPIGGFSEEDLAGVKLFAKDSGLKFGYFYAAFEYYVQNGDSAQAAKMAKFKEYFDGIRKLSDYYGAGDILEKIVGDTLMETYLYAQPLGASKVRRVRQFISIIKSADRKLTVRETLKKLSASGAEFDVADGVDENAVTVSTMHASKGLEYPVVIVTELNSNFERKTRDKNIIKYSFDKGFALEYFDDENRSYSETLLRGYITETERDEKIKEEIRLFYVALTRAKYSLHAVYTSVKDKKPVGMANKLLDFIPADMESVEVNPEDLTALALKNNRATVLLSKADDAAAEKMRKDFAFNYAHEEDTVLPLKATFSGYLKQNENTADISAYGTSGEQVVYELSDNSTAAERGTAAHKILENFDFYSDEPLRVQAKKMVTKGLISERELSELNVAKIESAVKGSGLIKARGTFYKEQSFIVSMEASRLLDVHSNENLLVQGVIDLLIIDGEQAKVIDYKYSHLSTDGLKQKYRKQLEIYAYAVEKVLGKKVVDKTIINILRGETVKID